MYWDLLYRPHPWGTCPNCGHCRCCGRSNHPHHPFTWNSNNAGTFTTDAAHNRQKMGESRELFGGGAGTAAVKPEAQDGA